MSKASLPPKPVLIYIFGLTALLLLTVLLLSRISQVGNVSAFDIFFWGLLLVAATRVGVKLPFEAGISHSYVVALATAILFPPWVAPTLLVIFRYEQLNHTYPWYKDLFNRVQTGLAASAASFTWFFVNSTFSLKVASVDVTALAGIALASIVYFVVNVGLVVAVIHLASKVPVIKIWHDNFSWLSYSYLITAPVALFLASAYRTPLVGDWGGYTVLVFMLLLYFSRFYWDEKVKLEDSFNATIDTLVQALDAKDTFTRLHSERVAAIATDLARAKGLDEADRRKIAYGARIHDIGKVGIPDDVLLKPIRLTSQEFELIKSHTTRGAEILKPAARYFKEVLPIVLYHHERWDGRGYPEGRAGDAIPLWARIVCIADAYEAMTAGRSYSPPKSPQRAMQELEDLAGDQFDPELVKLFKGIWLQDPIWKDREVFLRSYTSPVPSLDLPLPSRSESAPATSPKSS
ncbi:HD domain-containing phosphohydrolase [Calidithermus chliarophilus]|uniref:HD domain-containing phosphohydrolase n=1 Tax=Calidithermus chliarophilus TaxID=52023 RepID=UPI00041A85A9